MKNTDGQGENENQRIKETTWINSSGRHKRCEEASVQCKNKHWWKLYTFCSKKVMRFYGNLKYIFYFSYIIILLEAINEFGG